MQAFAIPRTVLKLNIETVTAVVCTPKMSHFSRIIVQYPFYACMWVGGSRHTDSFVSRFVLLLYTWFVLCLAPSVFRIRYKRLQFSAARTAF